MHIIGIAGGSGSGKTTFSKKVLKHLPAGTTDVIHMDSYYLDVLPQETYTKKGTPNFDHPKSFDWNLLESHLRLLRSAQMIESPVYDFAIGRRSSETRRTGASSIILFEGLFPLFKREIRELLDIKCFLHVEADIRFTRRLHRDVKERERSFDSVISQYYDTVRPMYQKFLDPQRQYADFIVGEETDIAAEILAARIKELIK